MSSQQQPKLRTACLQTQPQFKQVQANQEAADRELATFVLSFHIKPRSVDLIVLPEMAFTGYCFENRAEIDAYLESREGRSVQWAQQTARRLECAVMLGFPEVASDGQAYNALVMVGAAQELFFHRKKHLYETDETWAVEGQDWSIFEYRVPALDRVIRICPAICMDLNPWRFVSPFENYEFATFAQENKADVVVCCMNWLVSDEELPPTASSWQQVSSTITYFLIRLAPLLGKGTAFIACNRIGSEQVKNAPSATTFTGATCMVELADPPRVLSYATRDEEVTIQGDIGLPPADVEQPE